MMRTVASFREIYQAHILRGLLETEGIPVFVADENMIAIMWTYSQLVGGVKVQVPEEFIDRARDVIRQKFPEQTEAESDGEPDSSDRDTCPECGSSSISPKPYSLWSLIPSLLFCLPIFFPRKKWACNKCGASWR